MSIITIFFVPAILNLITLVSSQQVGTTAENHPTLSWQSCTTTGGCVVQSSGKVVLDANWRWSHTSAGTTCVSGSWNTSACTDGPSCAANCQLEGADYAGTYGITTNGESLTLKYVTQGSSGTNYGSRVYLMASDTAYQVFSPIGKEITFDVDLSTLPCGVNGAVYMTEMPTDGGMSTGNNKAGAKYGTGYCDAQCPKDTNWINGQGNFGNAQGACCTEMDLWEANSPAAAYTAHLCSSAGLNTCSSCGSQCDPDGCDFNSYRNGNTSFYGKGHTVDTTKPFGSFLSLSIRCEDTLLRDNCINCRNCYIRRLPLAPDLKLGHPAAITNLTRAALDLVRIMDDSTVYWYAVRSKTL